MERNKTYIGYKPKDDNLVKLARYLTAKNGFKDAKNANNNRFTNLASNKIMNNKRF